MLHMLTYDLTLPGRDYRALITAICSYDYIHINNSCWVIRSDLPATQLRNHLAKFLDTSDNLIICDFHNWASYNLPLEVTKWLSR